jgi:soluble lytic murein transglycosylase
MKDFRWVRVWLWAIGAATVLAAALAMPAATAPSQYSGFTAGYQAYKQGDMQSASQILQAAPASGVLGDYVLFFLGHARLNQHDLDGAAANFTRLIAGYPESIFAPRAELALANIALTRNQPAQARQHAQAAMDRSESIQAPAQLVLANAMLNLGQAQEAYEQLQDLRRSYPHSGSDAGARALESSLLRAHPEVADTSSLSYLSSEAPLLLTEGQTEQAYSTAAAALALEPPGSVRASMLWVEAQASHGNGDRQERALKSYLAIAPRGPKAPDALFDLARVYWHRRDTAGARTYFRQLAASFPESGLAAGAMLRIGRTYEDEGRYDLARSAYLAAAAAHPRADTAPDARFRSVWLLYRSHRFAAAAAGFQSMVPRAGDPIERSMYQYWEARSLEQAGQSDRARDIFYDLASSTVTNYYPELAARRVGAPPVEMPAEILVEAARPAPSSLSGAAWFHLERATVLDSLALRQLELGELRRVQELTRDRRSIRLFLLTAFEQAGGYHDATILATEMAAGGEVSKRTAEQIRYPRAFWDEFSRAAARTGTKLYLLLALARQESLFDPMARSYADARGLMQLLPATAQRVAAQAGMPEDEIDLYDPAVNIELGSTYLKSLLAMFDGDEFKAIAAYNGGEDAVARWVERYGGADDEWVENIEFAETRNYVKKVVGGMREYHMLYPGLSAQTAAEDEKRAGEE